MPAIPPPHTSTAPTGFFCAAFGSCVDGTVSMVLVVIISFLTYKFHQLNICIPIASKVEKSKSLKVYKVKMPVW